MKRTSTVFAAVVLVASAAFASKEPACADDGTRIVVTPNEFEGTDVERINRAIEAAARGGLRVVVPRCNQTAEGNRDIWLLDAAILVRSNTVLELDNCHLKLSDRCRDNMIRSVNCGRGITRIQPLENITIRGRGHVLLEGADHPRATGDSAKTLGKGTYGTDAGVEGANPTGDWRNIGILLAHVEHFAIENLRIKDAHCWAVSLERCAFGRVRDLQFDMTQSKVIDGERCTILNQDGLDLRHGCHDITIENLSGVTGDDLVALTGIPGNSTAGSDTSTMVSGSLCRPKGADDIRNIILRNVRGHSAGQHHVIRFLNTTGLRIENVVVDGVVDTSPPGRPCKATLKIGDFNPRWGGVTPLGDTSRIVVNNVTSASQHTVLIAGSLVDSCLSNIVRALPDGAPITYQSGRENVRNVQIANLVHAQPVKTPRERR